MTRWTFDDIPDQTGRTAVVTGANTGLGFETARMLALRGAEVVLACRSTEKAEAAAHRIRSARADVRITVEPLDLSDLESVRDFAARMHRDRAGLDLLINNAGVMAPPLSRTRQGFELQFGTNHLGHFALTAQLFSLLANRADARIVVVSSLAQKMGRIDFEDPNWERRAYRAWPAYGQSKLANMLFALELHRRFGRAGCGVAGIAAHPGWTASDLQRHNGLTEFFNFLAMPTARGALTTVRAATDPEASSGSYWGPDGVGEFRGDPDSAAIPAAAKDEAAAARLWDLSERLTGVTFAIA